MPYSDLHTDEIGYILLRINCYEGITMSTESQHELLSTVLNDIQQWAETPGRDTPQEFVGLLTKALRNFQTAFGSKDSPYAEFPNMDYYMNVFTVKLGLYGANNLLYASEEVGQPFRETMAYLMGGVHSQLADLTDLTSKRDFRATHPYRAYRSAVEHLFSAEIRGDSSPREKLLGTALGVFEIESINHITEKNYGEDYLTKLNTVDANVGICLRQVLPLAIKETLDIFDAVQPLVVKETLAIFDAVHSKPQKKNSPRVK
jgi:hypothetical protein